MSSNWKAELLEGISLDPRVSDRDFKVYFRTTIAYANNATGECFPSQETIAADVGTDVRSVRRSHTRLSGFGWMTIEKRRRPSGRGRSNFYKFHEPKNAPDYRTDHRAGESGENDDHRTVDDTTTGLPSPPNLKRTLSIIRIHLTMDSLSRPSRSNRPTIP